MPQPLHQKYAAKVTIQRAAATRQEQALNAANVISQWAKLDSIMISKVGPHAPDDPTRQMLLAQREISEFLNRPGNGSKKSQAT